MDDPSIPFAFVLEGASDRSFVEAAKRSGAKAIFYDKTNRTFIAVRGGAEWSFSSIDAAGEAAYAQTAWTARTALGKAKREIDRLRMARNNDAIRSDITVRALGGYIRALHEEGRRAGINLMPPPPSIAPLVGKVRNK